MYIHVIFNPNQVIQPQGNKVVQYFKILNSVILDWPTQKTYTLLNHLRDVFRIKSCNILPEIIIVLNIKYQLLFLIKIEVST